MERSEKPCCLIMECIPGGVRDPVEMVEALDMQIPLSYIRTAGTA